MILHELIEKKKANRKSLAVLIDPDKVDEIHDITRLVHACIENCVDYILVGGSLITTDNFSTVISTVKSICNIPVIIFPGYHLQIDTKADGILLLSLISGRNPEFLIGQHVHAAPVLKKSKLEIVPVGYMLINNGPQTSASYMSNTTPIPSDKPTIAACTAMAGEMLGLKALYLEAGSGAQHPVPQKIITKVSRSVDIPVIVGGGLNSIERVTLALEAGADMLVIGNALEKSYDLLPQVADKIQSLNKTLDVN
ncbi:geranylgeranylglyceryl/heptaprenylglyceryl phosphate synthase [Reichenbachiella versicolor]|uniref:geranylgeranylglyceryl/heptaprenylglyceryl phosphate synthase n=1 Tax=Reichenbachiella versicolor TaxID=1821036 RepID=UPI000D6E8165|nr:geranylgeranylglyceryl/heptaprenylglyceryl phosphate synthase [Reichenbachiella versicolor]